MIWLPVESDSEIITKYANKLGLKDCHEFIDLYSFDPSTAAEFGVPVDQCKGMILLFPLSEQEEEETFAEEHIVHPAAGPKFIKQTIENSCCMMALLHILLNDPEDLLKDSKPEIIKILLEEKSSGLEKLIEESSELESIHKEMALIGGTDVPDITENVQFHFVALIPGQTKNSTSSSASSVWLMDGRRSGPIEFESKEGNNFFEAACKIANEGFFYEII